jgi:hypothetical protein
MTKHAKEIIQHPSDPFVTMPFGKFVTPTYRQDTPPTPLEDGPMDPNHLPTSVTDGIAELTPRNEFIIGKPLHEASAVFGGLRRLIINRQLDRIEERVSTLRDDDKVLRYVGESIIRGTGYLHDANYNSDGSVVAINVTRPQSKAQLSAASTLEALTHKRRIEQAHASNIHKAYPEVADNHGRIAAFPKANDPAIRRTRGEDYNLGRNVRSYQHANHKIHKLDQKFQKIVYKDAEQAIKLIEKRDELLIKGASIKKAQDDRTSINEMTTTFVNEGFLKRKAAKEHAKNVQRNRAEHNRPADIIGAGWMVDDKSYSITARTQNGELLLSTTEKDGAVTTQLIDPNDLPDFLQ